MESLLIAEVQLWLELLRAHESLVNLREATDARKVELDSCFVRLEASLEAYRRWLASNREGFARVTTGTS